MVQTSAGAFSDAIHVAGLDEQFLINIDLVDEIILRENMVADIKTKSGRLVPVSRRYLRVLREKLHF